MTPPPQKIATKLGLQIDTAFFDEQTNQIFREQLSSQSENSSSRNNNSNSNINGLPPTDVQYQKFINFQTHSKYQKASDRASNYEYNNKYEEQSSETFRENDIDDGDFGVANGLSKQTIGRKISSSKGQRDREIQRQHPYKYQHQPQYQSVELKTQAKQMIQQLKDILAQTDKIDEGRGDIHSHNKGLGQSSKPRSREHKSRNQQHQSQQYKYELISSRDPNVNSYQQQANYRKPNVYGVNKQFHQGYTLELSSPENLVLPEVANNKNSQAQNQHQNEHLIVHHPDPSHFDDSDRFLLNVPSADRHDNKHLRSSGHQSKSSSKRRLRLQQHSSNSGSFHPQNSSHHYDYQSHSSPEFHHSLPKYFGQFQQQHQHHYRSNLASYHPPFLSVQDEQLLRKQTRHRLRNRLLQQSNTHGGYSINKRHFHKILKASPTVPVDINNQEDVQGYIKNKRQGLNKRRSKSTFNCYCQHCMQEGQAYSYGHHSTSNAFSKSKAYLSGNNSRIERQINNEQQRLDILKRVQSKLVNMGNCVCDGSWYATSDRRADLVYLRRSSVNSKQRSRSLSRSKVCTAFNVSSVSRYSGSKNKFKEGNFEKIQKILLDLEKLKKLKMRRGQQNQLIPSTKHNKAHIYQINQTQIQQRQRQSHIFMLKQEQQHSEASHQQSTQQKGQRRSSQALESQLQALMNEIKQIKKNQEIMYFQKSKEQRQRAQVQQLHHNQKPITEVKQTQTEQQLHRQRQSDLSFSKHYQNNATSTVSGIAISAGSTVTVIKPLLQQPQLQQYPYPKHVYSPSPSLILPPPAHNKLSASSTLTIKPAISFGGKKLTPTAAGTINSNSKPFTSTSSYTFFPPPASVNTNINVNEFSFTQQQQQQQIQQTLPQTYSLPLPSPVLVRKANKIQYLSPYTANMYSKQDLIKIQQARLSHQQLQQSQAQKQNYNHDRYPSDMRQYNVGYSYVQIPAQTYSAMIQKQKEREYRRMNPEQFSSESQSESFNHENEKIQQQRSKQRWYHPYTREQILKDLSQTRDDEYEREYFC